jgi:U4/U6.U5 tri-snRNP-associated protein 1
MDAISIEEANKIRVAMGMKPLPVPGAPTSTGPVFKDSKKDDGSDEEPASTLETRTAASYDNWKKLQDEAEAKAKREAQKAAIKKAREQAQRFAKLDGQGLGEGEDDVDTKTWLLQSKKRQKKAKKLEEELAERERQALAGAEYTAADLAGVKVGHELNEFGEGEEQILVLKDTAVDDEDEDDQLEAVELKEKENLKEKLESKKRKRVYDPNDVDESGQRSILGQYDEEIEGKKRKVFTLDGQGRTVEEAEMAGQDASELKKGISISLDILKDDTPISDYKDISEVKVRKPKKKKSKTTRKKTIDDDDIFPVAEMDVVVTTTEHDTMEIDAPNSAPVKPKKSTFNESFIDDEDLQANLATQRRAALKKRKKMRPEDIARQLREEESATPDIIQTTEEPEEEPGLVIDETSEFVANLQKPAAPERQRQKSSQPANGTTSMDVDSPLVDVEGNVEMAQSYNEVEDEQERQERAMRSVSADITGNGLEEEATLNKGVGSALTMLKQRGLLKTTDSGDLNAYYRERQRFLADKQNAETQAERLAREQRDRDRKSGRLDQMTPREREEWARRNNTQRDQIESRKMAEIFNKEYKPNVELKYVDEFGRQMNQKEAFKHLSHQFHGKGSGKQKTEKRLKKIEDEKKREAASTLDSSQHTGMTSAQGAQAKKHRQAGVRLQ